MKMTKLFLAAALIALGFTACGNEEAFEREGAKANITVRVLASGQNARSIGDLTGDGILPLGLPKESVINNVEVWVFSGGILDGYGYNVIAQGGQLIVEDIEATSGTRTMVVTANTRHLAIGRTVGTTTEAMVLAALAGNLTQDIAANGMIMTAEPQTIVLEPGFNVWGNVADTQHAGTVVNQVSPNNDPLPLTRINARIALVGMTQNFSGHPVVEDFVLHDVALFNVRSQSRLFNAATTPPLLAGNLTTDFWFGSAFPTTSNSYVQGTQNAGLVNTGISASAPVLGVTAATAHYFYVFENDANTLGDAGNNATFIVLRGRLRNAAGGYVVAPGLYTDAAGFTYYAIWVNDPNFNDGGTLSNPDGTIRRNRQYNITVHITGVGNPTIDPVEEAFLDVIVSVQPWVVEAQHVEW